MTALNKPARRDRESVLISLPRQERRQRKLLDINLKAIETNIEYILDHIEDLRAGPDSRSTERTIERFLNQVDGLTQRALRSRPESIHGLATQARIVALAELEPDSVKSLLANVEALAAATADGHEGQLRVVARRKYVKRNGDVTNPLAQIDSKGLLYGDNRTGDMFEADGRCIGGDRRQDLVGVRS